MSMPYRLLAARMGGYLLDVQVDFDQTFRINTHRRQLHNAAAPVVSDHMLTTELNEPSRPLNSALRFLKKSPNEGSRLSTFARSIAIAISSANYILGEFFGASIPLARISARSSFLYSSLAHFITGSVQPRPNTARSSLHPGRSST